MPRPEGRDERRVEGKDWAMAAKPEGRPRAGGKTRDKAGKLRRKRYLPMRVMCQDLKGETKEG